MITLLKRLFIKDTDSDSKIREKYGMLCGFLGIFLNLLLFGLKLFAGTISGSISITADAFNNLSDGGSSVITLFGFKLAGKKPDKAHPYGHGRIEYITGFGISVIILIMGFSLAKDSVSKLMNPQEIEFSPVIVAILCASILAKFYMAFYNSRVGKKIGSSALNATAKDSLGDCISTLAVLVSTLISHFANVNLDAYAGVFVSLFIFYAGISSFRESLAPILGAPPEKEFVDSIKNIVLNFNENIVGLHDLMVHDYGPGRVIISLHAEVPADGNILELHDIIDCLEKKLGDELSCVATIHMDPVDNKNPEVLRLKDILYSIVKGIDKRFSPHDFRVVFGETHTNLIFDIAVPLDCKMSDDDIIEQVRNAVKEKIGKNYFCVIEIDKENYIY